MRGLRLVGRGLRDTFDQLLPFIFGSVAWWTVVVVVQLPFYFLGSMVGGLLGYLVVILGSAVGFGPATYALMRWADPRRVIDPPEWRDPFRWVKDGWRPAFILGLIVVALIAILYLNIFFYGASNSPFAILAPLWMFLIILTFIVGLCTFAALALTEPGSLSSAFRRGAFAVARAPLQALFLVVVFVVLGIISAFTVVPAVLLYPAFLCTTVGRFVLNQLEIEIVDPFAPTDERLFEKQTGKDPEPKRGRLGR